MLVVLNGGKLVELCRPLVSRFRLFFIEDSFLSFRGEIDGGPMAALLRGYGLPLAGSGQIQCCPRLVDPTAASADDLITLEVFTSKVRARPACLRSANRLKYKLVPYKDLRIPLHFLQGLAALAVICTGL